MIGRTLYVGDRRDDDVSQRVYVTTERTRHQWEENHQLVGRLMHGLSNGDETLWIYRGEITNMP